jgi:hypothetical protein
VDTLLGSFLPPALPPSSLSSRTCSVF